MKKFLRTHPESILIASAAVLFGIIIFYFSWGINDVISEVDRGLKFTAPEVKVGYDLDAAAKLNLHGLFQQ